MAEQSLPDDAISTDSLDYGEDIFTRAVRLLKRCLTDASARHHPGFLRDVQEALKLLQKWEGEAGTQARESLKRQVRVNDLRRRR